MSYWSSPCLVGPSALRPEEGLAGADGKGGQGREEAAGAVITGASFLLEPVC